MMIYKEIIKALECCKDKIFKGCDNCPMDEDNDCIEIVCANAVDLINRQQAEIDRLKTENEKAKNYLATCFDKYEKTKIAKDSLENTFKDVRAKAIKEFVAKLKEHKCSYDLDNYHSFEAIDVDDIDDAVKEFLGEDYDR